MIDGGGGHGGNGGGGDGSGGGDVEEAAPIGERGTCTFWDHRAAVTLQSRLAREMTGIGLQAGSKANDHSISAMASASSLAIVSCHELHS